MHTFIERFTDMTLDIPQFIANAVRTQSKIHHLDINTKAVALDDLPQSVKSLITKDYGDKYLDDADYVAFFWGPIDKKSIGKLFNVVDKALGKSANKLTDKDFKKMTMDGEAAVSDEEVDVEETVEDVEELDEDEETAGAETEDNEVPEASDSEDAEEEDDEAGDEETEEDDEEEDEEEEEEVEVEIPTSYFFLKITMK